jgi:hypothetical protein
MARSRTAAFSVRANLAHEDLAREDLAREDLTREDLCDRFHRRADDDCGEIKTETDQVHARAFERHGNLPLQSASPWRFMVNNCLTAAPSRKICAADQRFMSPSDAWEIRRHGSNADVT